MELVYDDFKGRKIAGEPGTELPKTAESMPEERVSSLTTINKLLEIIESEKLTSAKEVLSSISREKLDSSLRNHIEKGKRTALWLINCEYTRRNVPPVFRKLPDINPDQPSTYLDLVSYDLQWLVAKYPTYTPAFRRFRKLTDPRYFHSQAKYIFTHSLKYGQAPIWKTTYALGLTIQQQTECHVLKQERLYNKYQKLLRLRSEVNAELKSRHTDRLLKTSAVVKLGPDDYAIIRRRLNIWFCAMLADWLPTKTGKFYDALTGFPDHRLADALPMTRQRAAKFIDDVKRDLPKGFLK